MLTPYSTWIETFREARCGGNWDNSRLTILGSPDMLFYTSTVFKAAAKSQPDYRMSG